MDAAIQLGFPKENLFPKRGKEIVFTINNEKRLVRGEAGEGAVAASQMCGFGDYSSFYRLYKKRTGQAPGDVKKKYTQLRKNGVILRSHRFFKALLSSAPTK